jgi:hypothetical protein
MSGTMSTQDANSVIQSTLDQYGLSSLTSWAWNEITNGASADQVTLDLTQTPQYAQRFPGIIARQKAGLPPISPADYISYEDQAKQLENQYQLPTGFLDDPAKIGNWIGGDTSMAELTQRVQNGYAQVAYAPDAVRQSFTSMFGANGDGALAAHFLDPDTAQTLLTQQATAAQIAGQGSMLGVNMNSGDAMAIAQNGQSPTSAGTSLQDLATKAPLYNATIGEQNNISSGTTGVEAEFGLSADATQQVIQREQERQANFQGGGAALSDQYGVEGVGSAKPE